MNKRDLPVVTAPSLARLEIDRETPQRYVVEPTGDEVFAVEVAVVPHGSDVLLVSLHGGVNIAPDRLPRFEWLKTLTTRDENLLFISDPTLTLGTDLINGWYVGDDREDLTPRLAAIVARVAEQTDSRHIVLFGSSAGGFAAARIGALLPDSVALAFSTQRDLGHGPLIHIPGFYANVFPGDEGYASVHQRLGARVSLEDTVPADSDQRFIWVQNSGDLEHMRDHFGPYREALGITGSGASASGTIHLVETYYGKGHPIPPLGLFAASLDAAIDWARTGEFDGVVWRPGLPNPPHDVAVSEAVRAPRVLSPQAHTRSAPGNVRIAGRASPGDEVALKIGKKVYQTVPVDEYGDWYVDQTFLPNDWTVVVYAHRPGVGRSVETTFRLHVGARRPVTTPPASAEVADTRKGSTKETPTPMTLGRVKRGVTRRMRAAAPARPGQPPK